MCPEWLRPPVGTGGFDVFLSDLGVRPLGTSLDRIDVDGHYEPSNCRWATVEVQVANRRVPWDAEEWGPAPDDWGLIEPKWPELVVVEQELDRGDPDHVWPF